MMHELVRRMIAKLIAKYRFTNYLLKKKSNL